MSWEPITAYDPNDSLVTLIDRVIEYLGKYFGEDPNAEGAEVERGFPNFEGSLPLQRPQVRVYQQPGGRIESPGYDDLYGTDEINSEDYERHGVDHTYALNIDVYTSRGLKDRPAPSGGERVRDRLQSKVLNLFSRDEHLLPEDIEVMNVGLGITQEPTGSEQPDIVMGRVQVDLRVQSYYLK